jgi:hypothetical protein
MGGIGIYFKNTMEIKWNLLTRFSAKFKPKVDNCTNFDVFYPF